MSRADTVTHQTSQINLVFRGLNRDILSCKTCQFICSGHKSDASTKKSRIRETKNLSTDADSRNNTVLERLRDLSKKKKNIY